MEPTEEQKVEYPEISDKQKNMQMFIEIGLKAMLGLYKAIKHWKYIRARITIRKYRKFPRRKKPRKQYRILRRHKKQRKNG